MARNLRALVVEDSDNDFELLVRTLRQYEYEVAATRVDTAEAMAAALREHPWDLVVSDWSMPSFDAMSALEVMRESGLELPFIIVSGTIGEETAVEALRAGAADFLLKDRLARLGVAVERELRDVEERRERARMQEQLRVSERMATVGITAAGVAHEINNPLAAVIANLDILAGQVASLDPATTIGAARPQLAEGLQDARAAAERVRTIVRDLKSFSRSDEGDRGPVDVEQVMESTLRIAANEIRHRARIVRRYEKVGRVDASEARLGQVFLNLLVNAAQALPEGRSEDNEICVATAMDGGSVIVTIADTGPGIPPHVMSRLFTPFVTTKAKHAGTGLGLSICQRIITSVGGQIRVDTSARGTTFTIELPVSTSDAEIEVTQRLPPRRSARRGKILVVDDDAMISRALIRALRSDHDVSSTLRGRDALAMFEAGERFDVILCDLMMPELSGVELYAEVARRYPDQASKIIFLTGGTFTPEAREFLERIENTRVEKPFDTQRLVAMINSRVQ